MDYTGYKLEFLTAVHFGDGSLEGSASGISSDTLFSALCYEAVSMGNLEELVAAVKDGKLQFSDAFPYHGDRYYLPKPMITIESESSSELKKCIKKMNCIPADKFSEFISGTMDIKKESQELAEMGAYNVRTLAVVSDREDTIPYSLGTYEFRKGWGLYVIIGYGDEDALYLLEKLLIGLGYSGIGGKRSSGFGRFVPLNTKLPEELTGRLISPDGCGEKMKMTLSNSMCCDGEMEHVCRGASFALAKRGGFISSVTYADHLVKKADYYCFKAGSVFINGFKGELRDVSVKGNHPVYRYAVPMFMEVRCDE